MRTATIAALLLLAACSAYAGPALPFQDFSLGPQYQTVKSNLDGASGAGTMYGLHLALNGSYLDSYLGGSDNRFRFGDYIGAYTTVSWADYKLSDSQYFVGLGLSLGAQAGVAVTDYLDVGARYFVDYRDNKFGSMQNGQSLRLNTAALMARLARLYIDAGTGSGSKAGGNETYRSTTTHVRYLFPDGGYAGVMMDNLKISYHLLNREDNIRNIVVQFGLMH